MRTIVTECADNIAVAEYKVNRYDIFLLFHEKNLKKLCTF